MVNPFTHFEASRNIESGISKVGRLAGIAPKYMYSEFHTGRFDGMRYISLILNRQQNIVLKRDASLSNRTLDVRLLTRMLVHEESLAIKREISRSFQFRHAL